MQHLTRSWRVATVVIFAFLVQPAAAQPALTITPVVAAPDDSVTAVITGPPGLFYVLAGSSVGAGFSYGGVALALGTDLTLHGQGVLDATGRATVNLTPPFRGTLLDRYYLQAATSPSPTFLPLAPSPGRVVLNGDLASGLVGPPGVVATNATGAYDFTNVNGFVASGSEGTGNLGASGPGARMVWYPGKAAFRAGVVNGTEWDDVNIGANSVALGGYTVASAPYTLAIGNSSMALATGDMALGTAAVASGSGSIAIGGHVNATAAFGTALGHNATASGVGSTAIGMYASTGNRRGAIVFGDFSTLTPVVATLDNQFMVRASGGTILYSSSDLTTGVSVPPGGGAWTAISDARLKTNFRDLDGEDVLARLARVPIREWNYITQDSSIRHVGPTAQDFRAAFGLGEDDRTISTLDPDGIALRAIQALDTRTQQLQEENTALKAALAALRQIVEERKRQSP
ncbi:MAG TPA: tail fiber domain-containing protein [Vicinamibacterales bacterium]|nr:tail fiber domain-containing protein [Vicinamibacterales bacterium]